MIAVFLLGLLLATLGVASYVVWPIERVEVVGNKQLSPPQVIELTGLQVGSPWLWAWDLRLGRLRQDPWIAAARLERPSPGQIRLIIKERFAVAHLEDGRGIGYDGVVLPGARPAGPAVRGSGPLPASLVLSLIKAVPNADKITYSHSGFSISRAGRTVWSASHDALLKFSRSPKAPPFTRAYVYSWGVSGR